MHMYLRVDYRRRSRNRAEKTDARTAFFSYALIRSWIGIILYTVHVLPCNVPVKVFENVSAVAYSQCIALTCMDQVHTSK